MRSVLTHLRGRGLKEVAYLGVERSDLTTGLRRHQAYLDYCREQGLTPRSAPGISACRAATGWQPSCSPPSTQAMVCASDTWP